MRRETVKRMLAFAVCILFIAVTLLSAAFVLTHARHKHDSDGPGGDCAACIRLAVVGSLLKLSAGALVCAAFGLGGCSVIRSAPGAVDSRAVLCTLVRQKIRLNI